MNKHLYIWEKAALCALCLTLLLACRVQGEREALSANTLRLHVIAASDEPEEQARKLRVRDAVLCYLTPLLADVTERDEAEARIAEELAGVARAAASAADGRAVTVTLGPADYPTRTAEGLVLPAGRYESLRVILGEGEGHNWWGLVFPQFALPAVEAGSGTDALAVGEFRLLAEGEGTELRFFLLEIWNRLVNRLH
ncbi:MAG: stage II sporulation protein R [Oscillospiraceae bacterium]|nr:stage II sporulation protein R [Oscillospiraceae bacterium]